MVVIQTHSYGGPILSFLPERCFKIQKIFNFLSETCSLFKVKAVMKKQKFEKKSLQVFLCRKDT